jgi:ABC-type glycerol-3-phosphate transport system permease component
MDERLIKDLPNFRPNKTPVKKTVKEIVYHVVGIILSLIFLFPIIYMLATSTKGEVAYAESIGTINMFLPDFANLGTAFDNYKSVLLNYDIWKYALNSFIYAAIVIVLNVLINGLAGYVMAKLRFPGKKFLSFLIIFLIVVPVETSIIPLYSIVKIMLGLKQQMSVIGVILPAAISIFNVFLFTQFFQNIPKEYEEAMHIDGANRVRIFFDLILPLSKPIVVYTILLAFTAPWGDYMFASVIAAGDSKLFNVAVGLQQLLTKESGVSGFPIFCAAGVIVSIPIMTLFFFLQGYYVEGVTGGAVKG